MKHIKVKGKYLYRAVGKEVNTIDFYLSSIRNTKAAKLFLNKALRKLKDREQPQTINTDKNLTYNKAIEELKLLNML